MVIHFTMVQYAQGSEIMLFFVYIFSVFISVTCRITFPNSELVIVKHRIIVKKFNNICGYYFFQGVLRKMVGQKWDDSFVHVVHILL